MSAEPAAMELDPEVRDSLRNVLAELWPRWNNEPRQDFRRVTRRTSQTTSQGRIEPYTGPVTWMEIRRKCHNDGCLDGLEATIRDREPRLLAGFMVGNEFAQAQDTFALVSHLLHEVSRKVERGTQTAVAIDVTLAELATLLREKSMERCIVSIVAGLSLAEGVDEIEVADGVTLRRMTDREFEEFSRSDIARNKHYEIDGYLDAALLEQRKTVAVQTHFDWGSWNPDPAALSEDSRQRAQLLTALHLAQPGRVAVVVSMQRFFPDLLPNLSGSSSIPPKPPLSCNMELDSKAATRFVAIYRALGQVRSEIRLAAQRLWDAEHRSALEDVVLDSVIGLETILNPSDQGELAFRVALNYAFLAPDPERRERYERIREIQMIRNKIVHSGWTASQPERTAKIAKHSEIAKSCLRDCLTRFLEDPSLHGKKKLDSDFWLDRVIPRN